MVALLLWACSQPAPPPPPAHDVAHPVRRTFVADGQASRVTPVNDDGPRVYYDAVHGARHLHDRDNRRFRNDYHTVSGWFRFLQGLRTAGYQVHAESHACFDRQTLDAFDVFVIGEQTYHGRFMSDAERAALVDWVRDGGGLLATVEHTNAHYMGDVFNLLAEPLPVKARFDSLCDPATAHPSAPDWVKLASPSPHPVTEGVDAFWFYNGCSLDTDHGVLMSSDQAWSDRYDKADKPVHNGNKRRDPDELSGPLAGVAAFAFGEGRVVVLGDHNGLSNTELYQADHHRFAMNAVRWLAGADDRPELVEWDYPHGYDVLVHAPEGSDFHLHRKSDTSTFRALLAQWGKEPQLRAWAHPDLQAGYEALVLGAPMQAYTKEELALIDTQLAQGRAVIWMATLASLDSAASRQLQAHFGVSVAVDTSENQALKLPLEVVGDEAWASGVLRIYAPKGTPTIRWKGVEPVVQLRHGAWHIEQVHSRRPIRIDLVAQKAVGEGTLTIVSPLDLFDDASLPDLLGAKQDVVRQQAGELALRLLKQPLGDDTQFLD